MVKHKAFKTDAIELCRSATDHLYESPTRRRWVPSCRRSTEPAKTRSWSGCLR